MTELTQKSLKEIFDYDPQIGIFFWKNPKSNRLKVGDEAGWITSPRDGKRYRAINISGKTYYTHRLVVLYMTGKFPPHLTDHINGNGLDNRWDNIRCVTCSGNNQNTRKRKDNKSGYTGVSWYKRDKSWEVRIKTDGKYKFVGRFKTKQEAVNARHQANIEYGFHQNHGQNRPL